MENSGKKKIKRAITTGAIITLAATGLTLNHKYNPPIQYEINEETDENDIVGDITFNKLSQYKVITVLDLNGEYKYFIGKYNVFTENITDLLTGQKYDISSYPDVDRENITAVNFEKEEDIDSYLITLDMVKARYSNEDLEELYNNIVAYKNSKEKGKTLTK